MDIVKRQNSAVPMTEFWSKVPEITLYFWIIKVLCTTVGETASDFLNVNLNFGLTGTSIVMGILLIVALFFQFHTDRYVPWAYWLSVVLISVFGTLVTDNLTDSLGVPLELSTLVFSVLLALTFAGWYATEKTLSIHSIFTHRREAFYWLTILFTFALGTAAGDLMAESLGLGYLTTGIIVAVVIAVLAIAWRMGLDGVLAFWLIYILTRPLGASIGDYLTQPAKYGGLGLGATLTSVIFGLGILGTVAFLTLTRRDAVSEKAMKQEIDEETHPPSRHVFGQVAATLGVLLAAAGTGYYFRQQSLQSSGVNQAEASSPPLTSASSSSLTQATASAPAPTATSPLGDLSAFQTITQDALNMVKTGDITGAKNRIGDLEYEWDQAEARLKPKDPAKWTEIDAANDRVFRELRAVHPNAESAQAALEDLLSKLQ